MRQYLIYVFIGLILMAPQELIVAVFRGQSVFLYFMALLFWLAMLSLMFVFYRWSIKLIKHPGLELILSMLLCFSVALFIEWEIIGNSPWGNPGANQLGLIAGWVSVFTLPRVFLENNFLGIKKAAKIWYIPFVLSLFVPLLLNPEKGAIIGVTIYGYSVIPFLLLSIIYLIGKWWKRVESTT